MVDVQSKEASIGQSQASTPNAIATLSIPSVDSRDVVAIADSQCLEPYLGVFTSVSVFSTDKNSDR